MQMIAALGCICSCPDMMSMMSLEADPAAGLKEMCPKRGSLMRCMKNEDTCAPIVDGPDFANGYKMINAGCAMQEAGCSIDPTSEDSMESCGKDFPEGCNEAATGVGKDKVDLADISEDCCKAVTKMRDCMGAKCFNMAIGAQMEMDPSGAAEEATRNYEKKCGTDVISLDVVRTAGREATAEPGESSTGAACHAATPALALTTLFAAKTLA